MFILLNLLSKLKAWRRAGVSPVLSNSVLLVRSTVRPLYKKQILCEPVKQTSAPMYAV
jgi:hypothetical protein